MSSFVAHKLSADSVNNVGQLKGEQFLNPVHFLIINQHFIRLENDENGEKG